MKSNTSTFRRLANILATQTFFKLVIFLLVAQALWIALSGRYPMAFDEDFHLGIIRLYAHHPLPFWSGQPVGADTFGAVARDPSYLYQFLMSFPYKLISLFTNDQTAQVLILRFINVGLFAAGLVLLRRLLLKTGASRALVHACLLAFVLIPIVPLLAAQINYDNLFLPATTLALLLTVDFVTRLSAKRHLPFAALLQLLTVCLLTSLVKYAFLPIFAAALTFVTLKTWRTYRSPPDLWKALKEGWHLAGYVGRIGWIIALLLASILFVERYGLNLVRYGSPAPDCEQVLTVKQCSRYGPWIRDYNFKIANFNGPRSPLTFTHEWLYGMWLRTFFAVDGPATQFQTRGPLPVPSIGAIIFAGVSIAAFAQTAPRLFKKYDKNVLWLFIASIFTYVAVLWVDEYRAFLRTGQPVAINGRYLLPVLPLIILIAGLALNEAFRKRQTARLLLFAAAMFCLAWGGGALTYILRSNNAWYWQNSAVRAANHAVQRTVGPVTPGYRHVTQFLR